MRRILNLGAGVQSTTVLLMSERGELPPLDMAIFADTQWEPKAVYEHLAWLEANCATPVVRVTVGNLRESVLRSRTGRGGRFTSIPLRTVQPNGGQGMVRRHCTRDYKIDPIDKYIRTHVLGLKKGQRAPSEPVVEKWFGISADEVQRCKDSDKCWAVHRYPLVEMRWSRSSCFQWLADNGYPEPPRSACIGCPYRSNDEWRAIKADPDEWEDACSFDEAIRKHADTDVMRGDSFIHRSCKPLRTANLDEDQMRLFGEECEGLCGV